MKTIFQNQNNSQDIIILSDINETQSKGEPIQLRHRINEVMIYSTDRDDYGNVIKVNKHYMYADDIINLANKIEMMRDEVLSTENYEPYEDFPF